MRFLFFNNFLIFLKIQRLKDLTQHCIQIQQFLSLKTIKQYLADQQIIKTSLIFSIIFVRNKQMKKYLEQTPSTSHKRSINFETEYKQNAIYSPSSQSNRRKQTNFSSKVLSLKSTINDLISSVSDKSIVQKNAVGRVWGVNKQLENHLSNSFDNQRVLSIHSARTNPMKQSYKTSGFGDMSTYVDHKRSQYFSEEIDHESYDLKIKQNLNIHIRNTNELMRKLKDLQYQHEYLRSNSRNVQNSDYQLQIQENKRLKAQLQRLNNEQSAEYSMSDLWREFSQLKEQNQRLREDTISMLKRRDSKVYPTRHTASYAY